MRQVRLIEHQHVVQDDVRCIIRRADELPNVLPVNEEGEVRERSRATEGVGEEVVDIDRGAIEAEGDRVVWIARVICRVVPCLIVRQGEVDDTGVNVTSGALIAPGPRIEWRVGGDEPSGRVSQLIVYGAVDKGASDARSP